MIPWATPEPGQIVTVLSRLTDTPRYFRLRHFAGRAEVPANYFLESSGVDDVRGCMGATHVRPNAWQVEPLIVGDTCIKALHLLMPRRPDRHSCVYCLPESPVPCGS